MPFLHPASYELPFDSASDTSRDAAVRAERFVCAQGLEVLHWMQDQGAHGATQKEASDALRIGRPSICARFHALEKRGALVKTTQRRDGCAVYQVPR